MTTTIRSSSTTGSISPATALVIVGDCKAELWGISLRERLRRSFSTAGITVVVDAEETTTESANIIIVRSDYVLDQRLVDALVGRPNTLLVSGVVEDENGMTPVAIHIAAVHFSQALDLIAQGQFDATNYPLDVDRFSPSELGGNYNIKLRKQAVPYAVSINNKPLSQIEKLTFDASYKGATDFVTKFLWPIPARYVTKWAAARGLTPNTVTSLSLVFVLLATWLFLQGHFLAGCFTGWLMTLLDTVDGKLARVTLTSSKWGHIFDHGIDVIHPPFWWFAWWHGLQTRGNTVAAVDLETALWVILGGYVLGRVFEQIFRRSFKFHMHIWRRVDYLFRHVTARRNPNLAILTVFTASGAPDTGFIAVAIWTVLSLMFHGSCLIQAAVVRLKGNEVISYMNEKP